MTSMATWIGLATTRLTKGNTLHWLFKLPVALTERCVFNIAPNPEQANYIKTVKILIIDETSIIPC